jgi:hypothetical protein
MPTVAERSRLGVTETKATVVIMASVFFVCRYLSDLGNIARSVPGVRSVLGADGEALTVHHFGGKTARIAPGRFRVNHHAQQVDWEITSSARYSGEIRVYGDSGISQLHSILRTDQPILTGALCALHSKTLHRIARSVEALLHPIPTPVSDPHPRPGIAHSA